MVLMEFIQASKERVDKDVIDRLEKGGNVVLNDALNQIHWRSLRYRDNQGGKGLRYVTNEVVKFPRL